MIIKARNIEEFKKIDDAIKQNLPKDMIDNISSAGIGFNDSIVMEFRKQVDIKFIIDKQCQLNKIYPEDENTISLSFYRNKTLFIAKIKYINSYEISYSQYDYDISEN